MLQLQLWEPRGWCCGAVSSRQGNNLQLPLRYATEIKAISPWRKANKKLPELWLLGEHRGALNRTSYAMHGPSFFLLLHSPLLTFFPPCKLLRSEQATVIIKPAACHFTSAQKIEMSLLFFAVLPPANCPVLNHRDWGKGNEKRERGGHEDEEQALVSMRFVVEALCTQAPQI